MTKMNSPADIASRLVPGRSIPKLARRGDMLALSKALLAEARETYAIPESAQTVAVGWTGFPGLEARRFVGASRSIRARTLLPTPVDHIMAPRSNAQFLDHAEQDVANAFIDAIQAVGGGSALDGEWLRVAISHAKGPCSACVQGLTDRQMDPGVLAQLSRRFPGLTVTLLWVSEGGRLHHAILQGGERL